MNVLAWAQSTTSGDSSMSMNFQSCGMTRLAPDSKRSRRRAEVSTLYCVGSPVVDASGVLRHALYVIGAPYSLGTRAVGMRKAGRRRDVAAISVPAATASFRIRAWPFRYV